MAQFRIDNLINPIGTDNKKPRFSWINTNETQEKYRILVSTDESFADEKAVVWDSGEIFGDENVNVAYGGRELKSFTEYYCKATINGKRVESGFFETAFLNPDEEFKAWWIGQPLGFSGCVDDIRLDVAVDKPVKKARFYVCMLGTGRVYLNGELLDDCYFDGGVTVYGKTLRYRTYPLELKTGNNALCMRVGYGFYGAKKVYGLLRIEYADGTVYEMPTIPGRLWNVKKDYVTLNGVYDGEVCDARKKDDWLNPEYGVSFDKWVATFAVDPPSGKFRASVIPPMRIVERFKPQSIVTKGNVVEIDNGANVCGFLSVKVKGERGSKITITHAEKTYGGKMNNCNYRAAESKDIYILNGDGVESYRPEFTYHGFQFAEIKIEGYAEISDVEVNVLRTDLKIISEFECSDETLNALHKIAVRTEGNNLNGVFTDCPQRDERLGWLNDLTARLYQSVNNFSLENFLPNFTDMIGDTQSYDGVIPDTVPYEVGCTVADPVSSYTVTALLAYERFADTGVIERNFDKFERWIGYLKRNADENDGTVCYGYYGDWCPAIIFADGHYSKCVTEIFMSAIYFLWYLKQMKLFAGVINNPEKQKYYGDLYVEYKEKFKNKYYDDEKKVYGNGSQTELAVCVTVFDEDEEACKRWMRLADEDVIKRKYHTTCGNQGYRHLIYNLCNYGYAETVFKLLTNKEYPGWGYMLECGATSIWERWENDIGDDMHSFNHPMFSGYDGYFINYLLGIRADLSKNAFKETVIQPCFISELTYCKGRLDTVRGAIAVEWKKTERGWLSEVNVPYDVDATFVAKEKHIIVDGIEYYEKVALKHGANKISIINKEM